MEFIMYPITVKMLAAELINVCDAYTSKNTNTEEFKKTIIHYATNSSDLLFNVEELNHSA